MRLWLISSGNVSPLPQPRLQMLPKLSKVGPVKTYEKLTAEAEAFTISPVGARGHEGEDKIFRRHQRYRGHP